jgi:hypothetical protein
VIQKERVVLTSEIARWRRREMSVQEHIEPDALCAKKAGGRGDQEANHSERRPKKSKRKRERGEPHIHGIPRTNQFRKGTRPKNVESNCVRRPKWRLRRLGRTRVDHIAYPPSNEYPRE